MISKKLSDADYAALVFAASSPLVTQIEDSSRKDNFGDVIPGMRTYKKLEKLGLLYFTEEDSDDEFDWTPMVELTEAGKNALQPPGAVPTLLILASSTGKERGLQ